MGLIEVPILLVLLLISVQDIQSRSVYWILFPVLGVLFVVSRLMRHEHLADLLEAVLTNILFLVIQLLLVTAWFSFKERHWINITTRLLGWGDVLFVFSIACYLSVLNFLFFYIGSLIVTLMIWLVWQIISNHNNKHIPLAGLQALVFALFLSSDWWLIHFNATSDNWLLAIFNK